MGGARFAADGWLLDPDSGAPLHCLRLAEGTHRHPGARYLVGPSRPADFEFVLAEDDGRTVRGTLSASVGSARISVGQLISAAGEGALSVQDDPHDLGVGPMSGAKWNADVSVGAGWRPSGQVRMVGGQWNADLALDVRWRAVVRVDVRKLLRANAVPSVVIALIGGREARADLLVDPALFGQRGDLATVRARAQRAAADGVLGVVTKRDVWRCRIVLHLRGRGVIGRSALLAARPTLRRELREGFAEFWTDLGAHAATLHDTLATLERESTPPEVAAAALHREFWRQARDLDQVVHSAPADAPAPPRRTAPAPRPKRKRHRVALVTAVIVFPIVLGVLIAALVAAGSAHHDSSRSDLTSVPTVHPQPVTTSAFAGTDLGQHITLAKITDGLRAVPDVATDDLTGCDTATIWDIAARATAPDGTMFTVLLLAVDLKPDPRQPAAAPTFANSQALGTSAGLGAGWRNTTELGPLNGPPWYPSATSITGQTLLIIHLQNVPGASVELRRLTDQLTLAVRQRFIAGTRP